MTQVKGPSSADLRKAFGVTGQPTECTEVWSRPMAFDHDGRPDHTGKPTQVMETRAWWLLDTGSPDTAISMNTYNGKTGKNYDAEAFTFRGLTPDGLKKKLRGYEKVVNLSILPPCIRVVPVEAEEAPAVQKPAESQME